MEHPCGEDWDKGSEVWSQQHRWCMSEWVSTVGLGCAFGLSWWLSTWVKETVKSKRRHGAHRWHKDPEAQDFHTLCIWPVPTWGFGLHRATTLSAHNIPSLKDWGAFSFPKVVHSEPSWEPAFSGDSTPSFLPVCSLGCETAESESLPRRSLSGLHHLS
jgi:hypothetical protein